MQILTATALLLHLLAFIWPIQGFAPSPAPEPNSSFSSVQHFPPAHAPSLNASDGERSVFAPSPTPASPTSLASAQRSPPLPSVPNASPAPAPLTVEEGREEFGDHVVPSGEVGDDEEGSEATIKWCAVRDQYEDCEYLVSIISQSEDYTWKCVKRDTAQECLDSARKGEADIINLEAGLAYTAFLNFSMKAIANEVYCDHAQSYDAVAVIKRKLCQENGGINLMDFKGHKSCHGSYSTAAGWNYPVNHIKGSTPTFDSGKISDIEIASSFFSEVCAPGEFEGTGMCSGCGIENGSCHSNSLYFGDSGAFRCLVEELGDIAFVRGDTALLYSKEGPQNQSWSSKSVRDFMYLCPQGGCREINGYPGSCSFGTVPANVIMARNSMPNKKRLFILQTLTNATRTNALYSGKISASNLLSPSTQEITVVKKLTRSYLGKSAFISQSLLEISNHKSQQITESIVKPVPEAVVRPKLIPDRVLVDIADDQPVQCTQDTCTQACQGALGGGFNGAQCVDGPGGLFCVCNSIAA
ncbi:hypothetical protein WN944_018461 [Citrus x changshan-huyou]|uniref:Transferrin-like domain-containing protein n=1 Tax=Citrus x changshan-huyou TaxID=2935761 RepID=A0AAP0QIJ2_9ROSI